MKRGTLFGLGVIVCTRMCTLYTTYGKSLLAAMIPQRLNGVCWHQSVSRISDAALAMIQCKHCEQSYPLKMRQFELELDLAFIISLLFQNSPL